MRPLLDLAGFEADPMRPSLLEDVPTEQNARMIRAGRIMLACGIIAPLVGAAIGALLALAGRP